MIYEAYCDGSSTGGVGPGGWGVVIRDRLGWGVEAKGGEPDTTNQRMEIRAVIEAISLVPPGTRLIVYSDSAYVVNCLRRGWHKTWRENGWRNAATKPVANRDLWEELLEARKRLGGLDIRKVRGHAKTGRHKEGNDRADALAVTAKKEVEACG